ncbi:MAG: hypothetical protein PVH40_03360 [Gemmatimonadales bacterium]|jgi:hypothetical protein
MSVRTRVLIAAAAALVVLPACGAGGGNVYVGVGVAGPYWGYPGRYPYPGYVGRPPVYWDDEDADDLEELAGPLDTEAQRAGAANGTQEALP